MDKDKWDKKLANKIRNLVVANEFLGESDEDITNKIVDLIRATRKHQREEWLKQLPSVEEIDGIIKFNDEMKELLPLPYKAIAIRGLIKEKLGEEVR